MCKDLVFSHANNLDPDWTNIEGGMKGLSWEGYEVVMSFTLVFCNDVHLLIFFAAILGYPILQNILSK